MATTVFRIEKNKEFVVMSNKFLRNKEMSLKSKGLLALCLSLPEDWNYSLNGLCAIVKENQTSIRSALKELEKHGHLERRRQKDKKGQFIYEYILYEVPYTGFQYADKQNTEKPNTEEPHVKNHIEQKIKKKSIEEQSIKEKLYLYIEEHISNKELQQLYKDYVEMREQIKKPLTERGLKMIITRCERLSNCNMNVQKLLLENAIINNWLNVYLPKEEEVKTANKHVLDELKGFYGE